MLTVAMRRVRKLSDDHVVRNKGDAIEGLKSILKLKPVNAVKINQRLSATSALNNYDNTNSSVHAPSDR